MRVRRGKIWCEPGEHYVEIEKIAMGLCVVACVDHVKTTRNRKREIRG